uniref:Uncharacterized protein n=1 Tax=Anguilla anguilla TaxID=7936 RepID=A0A0E9WK84_ANGAN
MGSSRTDRNQTSMFCSFEYRHLFHFKRCSDLTKYGISPTADVQRVHYSLKQVLWLHLYKICKIKSYIMTRDVIQFVCSRKDTSNRKLV